MFIGISLAVHNPLNSIQGGVEPGAIADLTATTADPFIDLAFTPAADAVSHQWRWSLTGENDWSAWATLPVGGDVDDFPDGTALDFQVRGVGPGGRKGAPSNIDSATTPWLVPSDIGDLDASAIDHESVLLSFPPATSATGYEYRIDGGSWVTLSTSVNGELLEGTVAGLFASQGSELDFEVRAINPSFNGAESPVASVTIPLKLVFAGGVNDETDLATYPFADVPLGIAAADRFIVVGIYSRFSSGTNPTISSVTIGGVVAAALGTLANTGDDNSIQFWGAVVPTGATGAITVVWSRTALRCHIAVAAVYGLENTTLRDQAADTVIATDLLSTNTLDVLAGGVAIGFVGGNTASSWTWTGLTERYDNSARSMAMDFFATAQTNMTINAQAAVADAFTLLKVIALR